MIRFGNTTVVCSIKSQLTRPSLKSPKQGFIQTLVLLPRTQAWSSYGRRQQIINENLILSQQLLDIIFKSEIINLEDLCIEEGKWVWCLFIDFLCINNDGNLLDCCLLSLTSALRQTYLFTVKIDNDTQKPLVYTKELTKLKLIYEQEPLSCTLAVYNNQQQSEQILITDPTLEEEQIATTIVNLVLYKSGQICLLHKSGGQTFTKENFQQCYELAK